MIAQDSGEGAAVNAEQQRMEDAVREFTLRRATIEQAKGMLMFIYGVSEGVAFETLRRMSQQHNVKLRTLAGRIVTDLVEWSQLDCTVPRVAADHLLLAAAERRADLISTPEE
jgi:hypothetical protein